MTPEQPWDNSQTNYYHHQIDWCNTTIQANQDKNIFLMLHHGLNDTTYTTEFTNTDEGGNATWSINNTNAGDLIWILNNYNVTAWFHGHCHLGQYRVDKVDLYTTKYGCFHGNIGTICTHGSMGDTTVDSVYLILENESSTVTVAPRNQSISPEVWYGDSYNETFTLDFPFNPLGDKSNTPPTLSNPSPLSGNYTDSLSVNWSIDIADDNSTFNWNITCSSGNASGGVNQVNGTKYLNMTNLTCGINYTVWVNASDGAGATINEIYYFNSQNCTNVTRIRICYEPDVGQVGVNNSMFTIVGMLLIISSILMITIVVKKGGIL